ncbi:MAG: hypothetical protein E3K37_07955 [Candidatus Kuenenia sp.]|nr:hypothetical protein [Candidatus Kuenenia hertensis]
MPITKELKNLKKPEAVGFLHEQAETLADVIEESHIDGQQNLKDFIRSEISNLELRMKTSQSEMETRRKTSQADLLIKYSAIIVGFISIALATAKLLWQAPSAKNL